MIWVVSALVVIAIGVVSRAALRQQVSLDALPNAVGSTPATGLPEHPQPSDLDTIRFATALRGYDPLAVDRHLDAVRDAWAAGEDRPATPALEVVLRGYRMDQVDEVLAAVSTQDAAAPAANEAPEVSTGALMAADPADPTEPTDPADAGAPTGARPERPAYRLVERHDHTDGFTDLTRDLDALVPDWREREAWVCGPTGLLDSAESLWETAELTHQLHVERFRPTIIEGGEGGEITFLRTDVSVDADGTTPILDAGEEAGVLMPSGCRMGICFGCVVTMREGAVRDLRTGEVTIAEPGDELPIQTCINAVAGTCDLDL